MCRVVASLLEIGLRRPSLTNLADAPSQSAEGAPNAWLEIHPRYMAALQGVEVGNEVVVIAWVHQVDHDSLQTHPRNDLSQPLAGFIATRSPDRPNPLGLHRMWVRERLGLRVRIGPIETIDGTPVVETKAVLQTSSARD